MHLKKERGHWYLVNNKAMAQDVQLTISIVLHALGSSNANLCGSTQNVAHLLQTFAERCLEKHKCRLSMLCAGAQPVSKDVNIKVWEHVNGITQDEIAHAIKGDKYIMNVGEKMYNRQR